MYEWAVSSGTGESTRVSPVGVTDEGPRALTRMLEALHAVPGGVPACGWVTVIDWVSVIGGYDRYQSPVQVERDSSGAVRWTGGAWR